MNQCSQHCIWWPKEFPTMKTAVTLLSVFLVALPLTSVQQYLYKIYLMHGAVLQYRLGVSLPLLEGTRSWPLLYHQCQWNRDHCSRCCGQVSVQVWRRSVPDLQQAISGSVPFYRYFIGGALVNHFYTTSATEIGTTTRGQRGNYGYISEGIVGYFFPTKKPGTIPLHRYYSPSGIDQFYTTDSKDYHSQCCWEIWLQLWGNCVLCYSLLWMTSVSGQHTYNGI